MPSKKNKQQQRPQQPFNADSQQHGRRQVEKPRLKPQEGNRQQRQQQNQNNIHSLLQQLKHSQFEKQELKVQLDTVTTELEEELDTVTEELAVILCCSLHLSVLIDKLAAAFNIPEGYIYQTSDAITEKEHLAKAMQHGYTDEEDLEILREHLQKIGEKPLAYSPKKEEEQGAAIEEPVHTERVLYAVK